MRSATLVFTLIVTTSLFASPRRRAASPDRCTEVVAPAALSFPAGGGSATASVTVGGGCPWSPVASDSWLSATQTSGGISITASANPSTAPRTALIHIRAAVIVVTQDPTTNLVQNGSFDTSLAGWSTEFSLTGSTASAVNGTAVLTTPGGNGASQLSQCVNIAPSTRYQAGTNVLAASGESNGLGTFGVFEYWTPNCDPIGVFHGRIIKQFGAPISTPFVSTIAWTSDPNARSVLIAIGAGSTAGPFTVQFDDVYLRPNP